MTRALARVNGLVKEEKDVSDLLKNKLFKDIFFCRTKLSLFQLLSWTKSPFFNYC